MRVLCVWDCLLESCCWKTDSEGSPERLSDSQTVSHKQRHLEFDIVLKTQVGAPSPCLSFPLATSTTALRLFTPIANHLHGTTLSWPGFVRFPILLPLDHLTRRTSSFEMRPGTPDSGTLRQCPKAMAIRTSNASSLLRATRRGGHSHTTCAQQPASSLRDEVVRYHHGSWSNDCHRKRANR